MANISDIETWLKANPNYNVDIEWGAMSGKWNGIEETISGYIVSLRYNNEFCCSSAPHDTIGESFEVVIEHIQQMVGIRTGLMFIEPDRTS